MATPSTPILPDEFFAQADQIKYHNDKVRWYYCVIVNLAALNYPDVIPQVWDHLWRNVCEPLDQQGRFEIAQKVREALIKACGIMGPAKTGVAIRTLGKLIPEDLRDPEARRANETQEEASKRGRILHERIYGRNTEFDMSATPNASVDYTFVVRTLLYGHIFSFDKILNDLDTGYVIVSTLIGIDCQYQLRNHQKGMLYNGATREELQELLDLCLGIAKRLDVKFRSAPHPIPSI